MMRTAIGPNRATHRIALLLTAAVMASLAVMRADAADAIAAGPKIAAAHVGFKNHYKLGFWTSVAVDVSDAGAANNLRVNVEVVDSEGVPTTASTPLEPARPLQRPGDSGPRTVVYTMMGRVGSPFRISLTDGEQIIDQLELRPNAKAHDAAVVPLSATSELIVSLGSEKHGLQAAFPDRAGSAGQMQRTLIELSSVDELPLDWFGYEAVDVLVIAVGDGKLCQALAADQKRFAALEHWVELGGRLVILCGGENAEAILGKGGPLASLVPGKLMEVVRLPEFGSLERFADPSPKIVGTTIQVPRLADVEGTIDVYEGRKPTDLPLVVRTARGFGEVSFVGVEFNQPPLAEWAGRTAFLRALLKPYLADAATADSSQRLVTSGFADLSGALRQRLGRSFPSVVPIAFPVVTGLVIAYLLFLGPFDYLLVHRWLRRPLVAWISFPLIVAAFSLLALAVGNWSRGSASTQINRLTLVDYDTISGNVRGTFWSTLYSPDAKRFDLTVKIPNAGVESSEPSDDSTVLLSWWGLPGLGIGGMQTGGDLGIVQSGYLYGPERKSLEQLPVLPSATKSLFARWAGKEPTKVEAQLEESDGLVVGSVVNQTSQPLRNARLFYGTWAYKLGTLNAGERIAVGEELSPRKAKTIATRDALGENGATGAQVESHVFAAEQASAKDILNLMMFYETAGGVAFAHLPNRYQAYVDFSRQLELGRAVLVGEAAGAGADVMDGATGEVVAGGESEGGVVVYRFVLPVKRQGTP